MTLDGWIQIALFAVAIVLLVKPLGGYMTRVFAGERTFLSPVLGPLERILYRLAGVDARTDQSWLGYAISMLLFNLVGFLGLYALMRLQAVLPFSMPAANRSELATSAGRPPCRAISRPTCGDTRPAVSSPAVTPPITASSGQPVSRITGGASTAGK